MTKLESKGRTTRVLVVDDDYSIRDALRLILEDAGYQVAEAGDGMAALEVLRGTPDHMVVLLDLMMPRLDGAGVLGAVAADPQLSKQHAYLMMTASNKTLSLAFARLLTDLAVPIIPKPFDLETVLDAVAHAADRLVVA